MNANELADGLEDAIEDPWNAEEWVRVRVKEAATMLRQQQAQIEHIRKTQNYFYKAHDKDKAEIEALKAHPVKEQLKEVELKATFNRGYKEGARDYANKCNPVKEQLTDEEILNIILKYESESGDNTTYDVLSCIREIIRKAQEK